ncbi:MAG: cobalt/nickel transport system permease protein [Actinomycetota bacterium]|nr:cobalt/nickel transport system permease protein [Actinomycetota bacterium]
MTTPDWLIEPETRLGPCECCGRRSKADLVEKTIAGAVRVLRAAMFSADLAAEDGFLQRVDARVKAGLVLALLVVSALVRHVSVLVGLYASILLVASVSRVPVRLLVRRVWLFVPLFTGVVVLPAALSVITPGHVVVPLGTWFGTPVGFTAQGLTAAALIVMRAATSISLVVVLTITTPWPRLLAALRALFVPRAFVLVLALAYRYLFHLLGSVTDMYEARKARAPRDHDLARGRAFVAATAGATFGKAHALSEEVYLAMVARGYRGQATATDRGPLRSVDLFVVGTVVAAALVVIGVDHVVAH